MYQNIITGNFASLVEGKQQHYLQKFCILKEKKKRKDILHRNLATLTQGSPKASCMVFISQLSSSCYCIL